MPFRIEHIDSPPAPQGKLIRELLDEGATGTFRHTISVNARLYIGCQNSTETVMVYAHGGFWADQIAVNEWDGCQARWLPTRERFIFEGDADE